MTTAIRYLRMFLHSPAGVKNLIGYLSQYGDILRVSFNDDYVSDANRPTLSLGYLGTNEAATKAILTAPRDIRLSRSDGKWPAYFQNLLPEGHNRDRLAAQRGCSSDDEFELLKNWAFRYRDGVHPELAPLYDPVCITAFFEGVSEQDYALNRVIDKTVRVFTWDDLDALLGKAKVLRRGRILQVAKSVVTKAKADWPELLKGAPESMQRAIAERLAGGVALA